MKLVSYAQVNKDVREILRAGEEVINHNICIFLKFISHLWTLHDLVCFQLSVSFLSKIMQNKRDISGLLGSLQPEVLQNVEHVEYPDNLTIKNIAYFILAPTLCYQVIYLTLTQVKMGF